MRKYILRCLLTDFALLMVTMGSVVGFPLVQKNETVENSHQMPTGSVIKSLSYMTVATPSLKFTFLLSLAAYLFDKPMAVRMRTVSLGMLYHIGNKTIFRVTFSETEAWNEDE